MWPRSVPIMGGKHFSAAPPPPPPPPPSPTVVANPSNQTVYGPGYDGASVGVGVSITISGGTPPYTSSWHAVINGVPSGASGGTSGGVSVPINTSESKSGYISFDVTDSVGATGHATGFFTVYN